MMIPNGNHTRGTYFSVGITSFNPRLQERSSPWGCNLYCINLTRTFRGCCHRGRASTRPYIACCKSIKYAGIASTKNTPRVAPRSCRGDWEVARHTRMAHPRRSRGWCHRGRASTRPYIACCTPIKYAGITSIKCTMVTSRSCRGDREVARHTCNADTQSIICTRAAPVSRHSPCGCVC